MNLIVYIWMLAYMDLPIIWNKLRRREEALATTEWALLVAGVAALAIAVVAVVRSQTNEATRQIKTSVDTSATLS